MKVLFALYDKNDNFISCGFTLEEVGIKKTSSWDWQHRTKKCKLYRIPLAPQNDTFKAEDEAFIKEFEEQCYTNKEQAERLDVNIRTIFRHKAKAKLKGKVAL